MNRKIFRIYVDEKLRLICSNKLVSMNNFKKLKNKYRLDKVEIKEYEFIEMEKALNNLAEAMKEHADKFIEKAKEIFATRSMEEYFNFRDYVKYIKYKKYQKRVKNRKILYAKRKAKHRK